MRGQRRLRALFGFFFLQIVLTVFSGSRRTRLIVRPAPGLRVQFQTPSRRDTAVVSQTSHGGQGGKIQGRSEVKCTLEQWLSTGGASGPIFFFFTYLEVATTKVLIISSK